MCMDNLRFTQLPCRQARGLRWRCDRYVGIPAKARVPLEEMCSGVIGAIRGILGNIMNGA